MEVSPYSYEGEQLTLNCHLQPGAKRTEIAGLHGDAVKIRISAPPVDGKANAELIKYLAKLCKVPKAQVEILSGHSSRRKRVRISNLSTLPEELKTL